LPGVPSVDDVPAQLGPYKILGTLGRGAIGIVYLAEDPALGRKVALKILPPVLANEPELLARFRREASLASKLEHPGIVRIYGVDEAHGLHYYVMQYVEGISLRESSCDFREAARIGKAVAEALAYAHREGVLHRDIKPENILLRSSDGTALIADFGLARDKSVQTLTRTGQIVGTPAYMSPEQAIGSQTLDGRSDQYSLGATLYTLLVGKMPFDATDIRALIAKVLSEDAVPCRRARPEVPRDLETIVMKCMEKEPGRRYASCAALAEDLGRWLAGEPISARPVGPFRKALRLVRKHRTFLTAALFVVVALGIGGYFAVQAAQERTRARKEMERKYSEAMGKGNRELERRDFDEALEAFIAALSLKPGDREAQKGKDRARSETLIAEGKIALEQEAYARALERFQRALAVDPEHPDLPHLLHLAKRIGFLEILGFHRIGSRRIAGTLIQSDPESGKTVPVQRFDSPPGKIELTEGVYLLDLHVEEFVPMRYPLQIAAGETTRTTPPWIPAESAPPGMVLIPGGAFLSGDEQFLLHEKTVGPFFMDVHEVSVGEYRKFIEAAEGPVQRTWRTPSGWDTTSQKTDREDHPVNGVTWEQAYEYARWAGKHLPSDLEWEKAARGVDGRPFPWGTSFQRALCNSPLSEERATVPVHTLSGGASPYGVLHMAGNVAEWTTSTVTREGEKFATGLLKVMGGSFSDAGVESLKTSVFRLTPQKASSKDIGFRCAKFILPRREIGVSVPFQKPEDVHVVREFRVVDDAYLEGFCRWTFKNDDRETLPCIPIPLPYFHQLKGVKGEKGQSLRARTRQRHVLRGCLHLAMVDSPIPPGGERLVTAYIRCAWRGGNPTFLKDKDCFTIKHMEKVYHGKRSQIRFVLPENAVIEALDPTPESRRFTPKGLELFWDLRRPQVEAKGKEVREEEAHVEIPIRVRYRCEGVDLRFAEQDRFIKERTDKETGNRVYNAERELAKFSEDFVSEKDNNLPVVRTLYEFRAQKVARVESRIDFRSVELFGDLAVCIETREEKYWDPKGKITSRKSDILYQCLCIKEGGRWKRLTEKSSLGRVPGTIDRANNTYRNPRFRCRVKSPPRWVMNLGKTTSGFWVNFYLRGREDFRVVLRGVPLHEHREIGERLKDNIQLMRQLTQEMELLSTTDGTLGGYPAKSFEAVFPMRQEDGVYWQYQSRTFAVRNRCFFALFEIINGEDKADLLRKRKAFQSHMKDLREAIVFD
jgi:formylglycine-generating enzyme required for sulfatase activity